MHQNGNWFEEWFDSPFYHILYGHRDEEEATEFINRLIEYLKPPPESTFLDLACGKGRHALAINKHGFQVTGLDLSTNSIQSASLLSNEQLQFYVHDMREVFAPNSFDYVFNLFTSFGYFDNSDDLQKTMNAISAQLKFNGILVLDYLNTKCAEANIQSGTQSEIKKQGITFKTKKMLRDSFITKTIEFSVNERDFHFEEHVWRLDQNDFYKLCEKAGLKIQTFFGDYQLNKFNPATSDRLIVLAQKA